MINTPPRNRDSPVKGKGGCLTSKLIPAHDVFAKWREDPDYSAAFNALDEEFALAEALISARGKAHLTQEQLAQKMGTTQAV